MTQNLNGQKVKSLAKAIQVLECFSSDRPEMGITEIAHMTRLPKSTIHNIISTYHDMGYISFNPNNSKYFLGLKLLHFSYIINSHLGMRNIFLPYLQRIANEVEETTYLGIPNAKDVLYIESAVPAGANAARNILGERAPMYCTGLGKAMLAFLPDREERLYEEPKRYTETTITDKKALLDSLLVVRQMGYAVDNMEHEYGIKCVALPIFDHEEALIAAVSVSAPSLRMNNDKIVSAANLIHDILRPIQYTL